MHQNPRSFGISLALVLAIICLFYTFYKLDNAAPLPIPSVRVELCGAWLADEVKLDERGCHVATLSSTTDKHGNKLHFNVIRPEDPKGKPVLRFEMEVNARSFKRGPMEVTHDINFEPEYQHTGGVRLRLNNTGKMTMSPGDESQVIRLGTTTLRLTRIEAGGAPALAPVAVSNPKNPKIKVDLCAKWLEKRLELNKQGCYSYLLSTDSEGEDTFSEVASRSDGYGVRVHVSVSRVGDTVRVWHSASAGSAQGSANLESKGERSMSPGDAAQQINLGSATVSLTRIDP